MDPLYAVLTGVNVAVCLGSIIANVGILHTATKLLTETIKQQMIGKLKRE